MTGSIKHIITMGFGNGTFTGSPSLALTLGFGVGEAGVSLTGKWSEVTTARIDRTVSEVEIKK